MKSNDCRELISMVPTMNEFELAVAIADDNICLKASAMMEVAHRVVSTESIVRELKEAKKDIRPFWNRDRICDIAVAVLDIIGAEQYHGDDEKIIRLLDLKYA